MIRAFRGRAAAARSLLGVKGAALLLVLVLLAPLSCERESVLEKAKREYEAGRHREAVFLIRHYFKKGGERSADLLFLFGTAWLKTGSEAEAQSAFEECRKKDAARAPKIAQFLKGEAIEALKAGDAVRGKRMMTMALSFQSGLDFGPYNVVAGELYLDRREFDTAIDYLDRFLTQHPGSAQAAEAMIDLASAYEKKGDIDRAIERYQEFQESYPKSRLASNALWELENLLLREAETYYENGETAKAEPVFTNLASTADNRLVRERAHFLLGEICEKRGDATCAVRYYREVVNSGSSGRLVERAKERIEKLEMPKRRR
jgi:tetratricopeptide (TPR) repeat protein